MKKQLSEVAQCAAAIRAELKNHFPEIKFSVTSQSFSMGNAVRINWTDGVPESALKDIIGKYKDGDFDGMTDSYDYRPSNGLPRAKYISTSRNINEDHYQKAFQAIKQYNGYDFLIDLDTSSPELNKRRDAWTARNLIYRALHKIDLTMGLGIKTLLRHV